MRGFEDYYNIPEFPKSFLKDIETLNKKYKKKYPYFQQIDAIPNEWPEGNVLRLFYGDMTLDQIAEIDTELQKILKKHKISFELTSGSFTAQDEE